jgi:hypothetical protein
MLGSQVRLLAVAPFPFKIMTITFWLKIAFMVLSLAGVVYAINVLSQNGGEKITQSPMGALIAPPVDENTRP